MKRESNLEETASTWSAPVLQRISIATSTAQELDGAVFDGLGLS